METDDEVYIAVAEALVASAQRVLDAAAAAVVALQSFQAKINEVIVVFHTLGLPPPSNNLTEEAFAMFEDLTIDSPLYYYPLYSQLSVSRE